MNHAVLEVEPIDITFVRGHRRFADSGHGELLMPPPPSLAAGAVRSRMLADAEVDLHAFAQGKAPPGPLADVLGTPRDPGRFEIAWVALAHREQGRDGGGGKDTAYLPLPADLFVTEPVPGRPTVHRLVPCPVDSLGVRGSFALPEAPVLRQRERSKPSGRWWISAAGLARHLAGRTPQATELLPSLRLWKRETRLGIGMVPERRTVKTGLIYTSDAAALTPGTRFLVGVRGAEGALPCEGLLRFGGDGRGASVSVGDAKLVAALFDAPVPKGRRFRLLLLTPGLSPSGWLPPGLEQRDGAWWLRLDGLEAKLVAATVPRSGVASGWDLALGQPKPAWRTIPAGSVFWFEVVSGDTGPLARLREEGLWALPQRDWHGERERRRAEGYNRVLLGVG
ncbi:MAG: type III-B CRISPR module-associated protein Cmr3 [Planctomycetota bacterium]|nr:MAG: type III-B CRISPR module-associated protein Cmr3 [Planctomycetota bacterium]